MAKKSKGKVKVFGVLAAARRFLLSSASYVGYVGYVPRTDDVEPRKTAIKFVDGKSVAIDLETGMAV